MAEPDPPLKGGGPTVARIVTLVVGGLAAAILLGIIGLAQRGSGDRAFENRCRGVLVGTAMDDAFAWMGPEGYRPGCGEVLKCEDLVVDGRTFQHACAPDDCSQLWRVGARGCLVDIDPETKRVRDVELMIVPGG